MIGRPTRIFFVVLRVVLALVYLLPLAWIVITSLKSGTQVLLSLQRLNAVLGHLLG